MQWWMERLHGAVMGFHCLSVYQVTEPVWAATFHVHLTAYWNWLFPPCILCLVLLHPLPCLPPLIPDYNSCFCLEAWLDLTNKITYFLNWVLPVDCKYFSLSSTTQCAMTEMYLVTCFSYGIGPHLILPHLFIPEASWTATYNLAKLLYHRK
jgi:succinate dehydrogenase hydrophobic anchor subunit